MSPRGVFAVAELILGQGCTAPGAWKVQKEPTLGRVGWGQWQEEWLVLRPVVPVFSPMSSLILFELQLLPPSRQPRGLVPLAP